MPKKKNKREKTARNKRIIKAAKAGVPYSEIGKRFGISKKRAWEIVNG